MLELSGLVPLGHIDIVTFKLATAFVIKKRMLGNVRRWVLLV